MYNATKHFSSVEYLSYTYDGRRYKVRAPHRALSYRPIKPIHLGVQFAKMSRDAEAALPLRTIPSSPTQEYFRFIFNRADTDGDGFITYKELKHMIEYSEEIEEPLGPELVRRIHQVADTNHDGLLDFPEFVGMLKNPLFKTVFGAYISKYVNFVVPKKKGKVGDVPDGLYEDQYSCCPPKLGMIIMSIIEVVFFLVDEFQENGSTETAKGPMAKALIYDPVKRYEAYRFITYMLVHIGHLHLIVNLTVQIFLGIPLEMVHNWWRVLVIYFAGVLAGSLGTSITDPNVKLAGASGGVYALLTAHIATIVMNWNEMSFPAVQLFILLILTVGDVGSSIHKRYTSASDDQIGYVAHFAGAIAGLLVGIVVLKNLNITKKENYIWWAAIALYIALMLAAILLNVFDSEYFPH